MSVDILKSFTDAANAIKNILAGVEKQSEEAKVRMVKIEAETSAYMKKMELETKKQADSVKETITAQLKGLTEKITALDQKLSAHAKRVNPLLTELQASLSAIEKELAMVKVEEGKGTPSSGSRLDKIQTEINKINGILVKAGKILEG